MNNTSFRASKKKKWKLFGNILVIIAITFVVKRFCNMGINIQTFIVSETFISLAIAVANQTFTLCMGCYPWISFVKIFSGKDIPFFTAMIVYTKANIYKYIPGNVFQYIGKNKLASDMEINHIDVACSTILDVICGVIPLGIISVIMLGNHILMIARDYWKSALAVIIIMTSVLSVVILLVFFSKKQFAEYLNRYKFAFSSSGRKKLLPIAAYYIAIALFSVAVNFIVACLIFDKKVSLNQLITITGAYVFAWILGYITPGAPGGIGVRESLMLLVCGGMFEERVMIYALLFRMSSIISDILGFFIGTICEHTIAQYRNGVSK